LAIVDIIKITFKKLLTNKNKNMPEKEKNKLTDNVPAMLFLGFLMIVLIVLAMTSNVF